MSGRFRRGLFETSSAVALLCVLVPAAVVVRPTGAEAACALLGSADAAEVVCTETFDALLTYDRSEEQLLLRQDEGEEPEVERLDTDLSGNDRIELSDVSGAPAELVVSEGSSASEFVDQQFALFLREGEDEVLVEGGFLVGSISGGADNDRYDMNGISRLAGPVPAALSGVSFDGAAGEDTIIVRADGEVARLLGGTGRDRFDLSGTIGSDLVASRTSTVDGGDGDDTIDVRTGAEVYGRIDGAAGADIINYAGEYFDTGSGIAITGGVGEDTLSIFDGADVGAVFGGGDNDTINVAGRVALDGDRGGNADVDGGRGDDTINVFDGAFIAGVVRGRGGDDTIVMEGGNIEGAFLIEDRGVRIGFGITGDGGDDEVDVRGGTIAGFVFGGAGNDTIEASGGIVGVSEDPTNISALVGYSGDDTLVVSGDAAVNGFVIGDGDFIISDSPDVPELAPPVVPGRDTVRIEGGVVTGGVFTGGRRDTIIVSGGQIGALDPSGNSVRGDPLTALPFVMTDRAAIGEVRGNDDNDRITVSGGRIFGNVGGDAGNDTVSVSGGEIFGNVSGDAGDDRVTVSGGRIGGAVTGGTGDDMVAVSGGTIGGDVDGGEGALDRLDYTGGSLGGAIRGFETVTIDSLVPASLPISIIGTDVAVALNDTAFDPSGRSDFALDGVGSFTADGSLFTLSGNQDVGSLELLNGSILDIRRRTALSGSGEAPYGNLTVFDSGIDLIDGDTDDELLVGDFTVSNATIGVDVDPIGGVADLIRVNGLFNPTGGLATARIIALQPQNTIVVNLLEEPVGNQSSLIPVIVLQDDDPGDVLNDAFEVVALDPTSLAGFELLSGPGGSIFLRTIPVDREKVAKDSVSPSNVSGARQTSSVVQDVLGDIADGAVGFATGTERIQITPNFGVFSYGQFGKTVHDGLDFDSAFGGGTTSSFEANNFSVVGTAELDASAEFGLEDIGVKIAAFGGYTSTDVTLDDRVNGVRSAGDNDSGLFGASVLVSKIAGEGNLNYGLVSAAGVFGSTDVLAAGTGGRGDYGTQGVIVSAKVGRNMAVADRVRFDLRAGIAYAGFFGDAFTDSAGTDYGDSRVSFTTVSFEPGVSTSVDVRGVTVSPFARGLLSARLGAVNEAEVNGVDFDFDDSDFTVGAQVGANTNIGRNFSAGALVEGRTSGDESSILAKLSLKYTIPR